MYWYTFSILFFEIHCSLATEEVATEKNFEIFLHLPVLHATPTPSNNWIPKLVSKGKDLAGDIKTLYFLFNN